jgi:hypothetical protein
LSIHSSHELLERAYSSAKALGIQSEWGLILPPGKAHKKIYDT